MQEQRKPKTILSHLILIVSLLAFTQGQVEAEGRAKVKIGKVTASVNSNKDTDNLDISLRDNILYVSIRTEPENGKKDIYSIMGFAINETLFRRGTTYNLLPTIDETSEDGYAKNISLSAAKQTGNRTWTVYTGPGNESRATAKLKVMKYDPRTKEFKGVISGSFSPSTISINKNGPVIEKKNITGTPFKIIFHVNLTDGAYSI